MVDNPHPLGRRPVPHTSGSLYPKQDPGTYAAGVGAGVDAGIVAVVVCELLPVVVNEDVCVLVWVVD